MSLRNMQVITRPMIAYPRFGLKQPKHERFKEIRILI